VSLATKPAAPSRLGIQGFKPARFITPDALLQVMFASQSPDAIQAPDETLNL
jgi:hypothetical protein